MADVQLHRWFNLSEFGHGGCSERRLQTLAREPLQQLVTHYLVPLRRRFGPVTVFSGCRSRRHNAQVGGAPLSYHVYDLRGWRYVAADVACAEGSPRAWFDFLAACGAPGLGLYATHVHVDTRPGPKVRFSG